MNPLRSLTTVGLCLLWAGPLHAQGFPSLLAPADPARRGPAPHYAPVTAGLKRFGVVEPKDWMELNRAVGPQAGRGASAPTAGRSR
jgi:hypothetical protein